MLPSSYLRLLLGVLHKSVTAYDKVDEALQEASLLEKAVKVVDSLLFGTP